MARKLSGKRDRRDYPQDEMHDDMQDDATPRRQRARAPSSRRSRGGGQRTFLGRVFYWSCVVGVWGAIGLIGIIAYHATKLPSIDQLAVPKRPPNIAILASDGTLLANRGETGGSTIAIKELPKYLPQAFVAIEDRRFYGHFGIDPIGLTRALINNATGKGGTQGGSTLTQQLAKNIFLTQDRTLSRKIQEAILSIWLERNYSKDQILELYLNRVYFGSGAYGVEAAAQKYFAKSARAVTLAEAAVLAGLVQAPSRLAPNRNPEGAAERAAIVVANMVKQGFVSDKMASVALASPAQAKRQAGAGSINYAADWVMDVLGDFIGTIDKDIIVRTTIEPAMQAAAERALIEELDAKGGKLNVGQGALVAMATDGSVRALVGGRNYSDSQFNRAVSARRQPGSSFKPFVYLTALEKGMTPDTILTDAPITIKGWSPENYTREYFGQVPMLKALAMSLNTPVVRLTQELGARSVARTAQRLGISSPIPSNLSIALGTAEVTPLELTGAYAAFANGGIGVVPHVIQDVKGTDGKLIYRHKEQGLGRVIEPAQVAMMNAMLRETLVSGTARKAELPGWQAAGKTGTTSEYHDAWFVGYTSALVTSVWLGNDDGDEMKKVTGSGLPVEIWSRFMKEALKGVPPGPLPGGSWRLQNPLDAVASTTDAPASPSPLRRPQGGPPRPPQNIPETATNAGGTIEYPVGGKPGPSSREKTLLERLIGG